MIDSSTKRQFCKARVSGSTDLEAEINLYNEDCLQALKLMPDNYYDLAKSEDFLGVNIQPFIGINSQYNLARNFKLTLGYNFSKAFHLFNNSEEKISYNTHQIKVGFLVSLYR